MRFNVFPGPVCRHWTSLFSASLDVLSAGLLRSLSLFRFFSLSAFLSTPSLAPLSLSLISACRSPPTPSTSFLSLSLSPLCFLSYFNLRLPRQFPFRPPRSFSPPSLPPIQRRFASSITFLPRLATLCSPSTSHPPVLLSLGTCRDSRYEFRSQTFDNLIIHCEKNKRVFVPFQRVVETISRKGIALNRGQEKSSKTRRMNE